MSNGVIENGMNNGRTTGNTAVEPRTKHEKFTNEQLVARIRAGIDAADNMLLLWQQTERFIGKMALKYQGYADIEELKQEGYFGLHAAVQHYDAEQGVTFLSYAGFWIKQIMLRYIDRCGSVVKIPINLRYKVQKYRKIASEYRKYYGREATDREMRAFLDVDDAELDRIKQGLKMGQIQSLSTPIGEEEDTELVDMLASDEDIEEDVIKRLDTAAMKRELWIAVDKLPPDQSEVIRKRYKERMTRKDAGDCLGITAGAVQNLESKAMRTLRIPSRCRKFKVYFEEYLTASPVHHVGVASFNRTWTSEVEREALRREEMEREIEERERYLQELLFSGSRSIRSVTNG